jgi:hypothetical protein
MIDYQQLQGSWLPDLGIPGAWRLEYVGEYTMASVVTGPSGSGLMACNDPGKPTTFEVWFAGFSDPTGYLSFDELVGALKVLEQQGQQSNRNREDYIED